MPDLKLSVTVASAVPGPGRVGPEDGTLVEGLSGVRLSCQIQAQDGMALEIINRLGRLPILAIVRKTPFSRNRTGFRYRELCR